MPGPRRRLLRPGRPQGPGRHRGAPSRRRASSRTPSACSTRIAADVRPSARPARLADRPGRRAPDAGGGARRRRTPYVEHVARCFAWAPVRRDEAVFDEAAAAIDAPPARPGAARRPDRAWDDRFVIPRSRLPDVLDLAGRSVPRPRARRCSACPTARISGSGSSPASRGPATTGTTAAAGRGSTSTPTSRSGPRTSIHVAAHETLPGPPPRACLEGGRARRSAGPAGGEHPPDQHARVPDQRGSGRPRPPVRVAARRGGRPARRALRAGRTAHRRAIRPRRARPRTRPSPSPARAAAWARAGSTPP